MRLIHWSEEEWLKARADKITATDCAIIMGASKYKTPMQLWAEKLGLTEPKEQTEEMKWGLRLERPLIEAFQEETGAVAVKTPKWCLDVAEDKPWQAASLDADLKLKDRSEEGILELKTTSARGEAEWEDGVPLRHIMQVQHQMAVTGRLFAVVCALFGGQRMRWSMVERDQKAIDALTAAEHAFYQRLIKNDPPAINPGEENAKILAQVFNRPSDVEVDLGPDLVDVDQRLVAVKEEMKQLEVEKNLLENRLRAAIGNAMSCKLPTGVRYTWKPYSKKEYVVKAQTGRQLRRVGDE